MTWLQHNPFGKTYWRLDHAGWELSRAWKSEIQSGGFEQGTSAWGDLPKLLYEESWGEADYARGHVNIVKFEGKLIGAGADGEPIVEPTQEVARWEHPNWNGTSTYLNAAETLDLSEQGALDFLEEEGWARVPTLPVEP